MVHNGTGHKLLLDFLWAHPNSLDWPIKSSRPTKVCNVQYIYIYICIYLYIYIYIEREVFAFFREHPFFFLRALPQTHSHTPLWTEFWGLKGRAH